MGASLGTILCRLNLCECDWIGSVKALQAIERSGQGIELLCQFEEMIRHRFPRYAIAGRVTRRAYRTFWNYDTADRIRASEAPARESV